MKKILFTSLQLTWGILQSIAGFVLFLIYIKHPHYNHNGAIVTEWNRGGGVSLGLFVFVQHICSDGRKQQLVTHEYGHCIQSLLLGPLYLFVIGLPSATWAGIFSHRCKKGKSTNYYRFYTEKWAEKIAGRKV